MMMPQKIGRYKIKSELGQGGMATVFHAHDPHFERDVAIKVLPREFLHDPTFRTRFEREAKIIAALEHTAIVPVHDFGEDDGQPYLVMRYMPGGSLADRLKQGPLPLLEATKILQRIGSALDRAHSQGVIHRDLKPGNILFDQYSDSFLADFGIVKLTQQTATLTAGGIIGTPAYMSPEQAKGEANLDARSDIYALGAILYEMLTGQQPYKADTPMGVAVKHIVEPVPRLLEVNPKFPSFCAAVISQAMAKDRTERFNHASELAETLQSATITPVQLADQPPTNPPDLGQEQGAQAIDGRLSEAQPTDKPNKDVTILSKQKENRLTSGGIGQKKRTSILLTAIAWGVGLFMGGVIGGEGDLPAFGLIAGLVGGLGTGLTLQRAEPAIGWKQTLAITIGWLVGFMGVFVGVNSGRAFQPFVGVVIGGGVTGLALRQTIPAIRWKQVIIVVIGWVLGLIIVTITTNRLTLILDFVAIPVVGVIFGTVGGGIMFWLLGRRYY